MAGQDGGRSRSVEPIAAPSAGDDGAVPRFSDRRSFLKVLGAVLYHEKVQLEGETFPLQSVPYRAKALFYLPRFSSSLALTLMGRPKRLIKPAESFWSYTSSSSKVATSSSYRV